MESQRSAGSSQPILAKEKSLAHSIKAHLCQQIGHLADEEKIKQQYARKAAAEFVKSDPLGVYQKDEGDDGKPKKKDSASEGKAADSHSDKHKGVRTHTHRRKKKEDDIFKSFGKEHDSSAIQEVDGKMIVNYKRYWQSDPDLSRWQQGLVDKSRYDTLLFDVQHKWHEDFQQDRAELVQRHNALFRQRHVVESKELSLKKSSPSVSQLKELQTQMTEKSPQHTKSRKKSEKKERTSSHFEQLLFVDEMISLQSSLEKPKSYGEEQICNFIGFVLQQYGTLQEAFRKIDTNGSGEVSFHEFSEVVAIMGYRGDIKFVFYRLDLNGNGVLTMTEFLNLRPYMLKEMVRVSQLALINRSKGLPTETNSIWLKRAKVELGECGVLEPIESQPADQPSKASSKASNASLDFMESQDMATLRATTPIAPASPDDRSTCGDSVDSPRLSELSPSARRTLNYPDEEPIARQNSLTRPSTVSKSSQMRATISKRTLSLYIFRNADRHHSGQVVFMTRIPLTMEALLQVCAQELRPLVGPAECLLDTDLRPIRSLEEVCKGGTYLLKGKEALDPPPHMFAHRPPVTTPSYRCLKEIEMAAHAEANSRPCTSPSRPITSQASLMGGSSQASASTMFSAGRIGGPPQLSMCSSMSEPPKTLPMHEKDAHWQAEVRLNKHLTHGGKNLPPTHRRYDLWTVLPRPASVPSIGHSSRIDGMHSPAFF